MRKTKWAMVTVLIGFPLVAGFGYIKAVNRLPEVNIPNPTMPSPNAFDYFVKAGNAVKDEKAIGNAISSAPASSQKVYTLEEKEQLVSENTIAVSLLHQGFAYSYLNPPARSMSALFPYYAKFRGTARLLSLKGQTEAERGNYDAAIGSWLDAVQLGIKVPRGSVLIGSLVGLACEAIGRKPLWQNVNHLSPTQANRALQRLESLEKSRFPYAGTLEEEKRFVQSGLLEIFHNSDWNVKMAKSLDTDADEENSPSKQFAGKIKLALYGKGRIFNNITRYFEAKKVDDSEPYALHPPSTPIPADPYSQILFPVYSQARLRDVTTRTENALLIVALALRAYHEEKGAYPETLDALVPSYLKELPSDPFALKGTFRYHHQGAKFLLYSVGPDGKDDGGTPIDNPELARENPTSRSRYVPNEKSLGDYVVGVNTY